LELGSGSPLVFDRPEDFLSADPVLPVDFFSERTFLSLSFLLFPDDVAMALCKLIPRR
jgi:hypothetical protein